MASPTAPNLLETSGLPLAYAVAEDEDGTPVPALLEGYDVGVTTTVRSLSVMQKEAVVASSESPVVWRLSSDEGPYLQGHDFAPAPLAFMTVGMVADLMENIERSLESSSQPKSPLRLVLDNRFTMEGSLRRGTMVGGSLAPEITIEMPVSDRSSVTGAVMTGIAASATSGLLGPSHESLFSLTSDGARIPVGRVAELGHEATPGTGGTALQPAEASSGQNEPLIVKVMDVGERSPDAGASLQDEQHRGLHLRAECERRSDGIKVIDVHLFKPNGSTFRFLSDESEGRGGKGRAPDALTYLSAGLGFCFMTQIGRYAKIIGRSLGDYHIVQETRFSEGRPRAEPPLGGRAAAPRTHVHLNPDGDDDFARTALDMSEQTCFLHALCRTPLRPRLKIVDMSAPRGSPTGRR